VVVIPDILSKNASVTESSIVENIKGKEPKIAILSHESAVREMLAANLIFYRDLSLIKKIKFQILL
jgi:hypothetical protein